LVRGSERLTTHLSELAGLVLAGHEGFECSTPIPNKMHISFGSSVSR
jgi:hypothetical protein